MSWLSDDPNEPRELDESDVRVRPNPKGNRPRTKIRPGHADATIGMILSVDRGRFTVLVDEGTPNERTVTASRARELGKEAIVTGDRVGLVGDVTGDEGTLCRVVRIEPRTTILRRSADDTDAVERVIVANADQMLIVVAAANPEPRVRLVDRYLIAALDAGITAILCVTKTDIADPSEFLANFVGLDLPIITRRSDAPPLEALQALLVGHTTVAVGHSGVGKSTLVNALVPAADRAVGHVNETTGRGRHTSSSTISLKLETERGDGWIIDTPGVRSFGLGHINPHNILRAYTDLDRIGQMCPRGCTHLPDSPDCAIIEAVEDGKLGESGAARLDSMQRLLTTFSKPEFG
jgi:ribosome biogenesis GTPase